MAKALNTSVFIERSKLIYGDKYDHSKVNYINNRNKVIIICPEHGEYLTRPSQFLQGHGCNKCSHTIYVNKDDFVVKAVSVHGNKYDYSDTCYINYNKPVKIFCGIHGIFEQKPSIHLLGHGCPACGLESIKLKKTHSGIKPNLKYNKDNIFDIFKNVHNNKYIYNIESFINMSEKLEIFCPEHGSFYQTGFNHKNGHGCSLCKTSMGEKIINKFLLDNNIFFINQYRFDDCRNILPLPFDFYLPDKNICIEYDGKQHFDKNSMYYSKTLVDNDNIKNLYCKKNNIKLIRVPYWDFNNIHYILINEVKYG